LTRKENLKINEIEKSINVRKESADNEF